MGNKTDETLGLLSPLLSAEDENLTRLSEYYDRPKASIVAAGLLTGWQMALEGDEDLFRENLERVEGYSL